MKIISLKKFKYNYLLGGAVICCCLFLIILLSFGQETLSSDNLKFKYSGSFKFFVLSTILIAPIIEELAFRGFFLSSKKYKVVATIFMLLYLYMLPSLINVLIGVFFLGLYFFFHLKKKDVKHYILLILNSLLFAVIHYNFQNFTNLAQVTPLLIHISVGFILLWLLLNFSLKCSIFFHIVYNFIPVFILFLALQFPDNKINTSSYKNLSITWTQIPVFNQLESKIEYDDSKIVGKNITLGNVLFLYDIKNEVYIQKKPFAKYDIQIEMNTKKHEKELILDILEKEGLILKQ